MYLRVWEFVVRSEAVDAFVRLYGPAGPWVELFSRFDGFVETELLEDVSDPRRFVTVDRWSGEAAYLEMEAASGDAWRALDAEGEALTDRETFLGAFETNDGERARRSG